MNNMAIEGELILKRRTKLRRRMLHNCNIKLNNLNSRWYTLKCEVEKLYALFEVLRDESYLVTARKLLDEMSEIRAKSETYQGIMVELSQIEVNTFKVVDLRLIASVKLLLLVLLQLQAKAKLRRFTTEINLFNTEPFKTVDTQIINC